VERERAGNVLDAVAPEEERAISVITVSELLHGVFRSSGARRARRLAFVEHVLAGFEPIPITERVARVHADAWARVARRGEVIGAHDVWIAATAPPMDWASPPRTSATSTASQAFGFWWPRNRPARAMLET
jgi:predicted nucleic acid-binding protein